MTIVENVNEPIVVQGAQLIVDGKPQTFNQELVHLSTKINDDRNAVIGRGTGPQFGPMMANAGNSVDISIYVRLYHRNADGTSGARIGVNGFTREYEVTLTADDTTWVEATGPDAGKILGKVGEELIEENTQPQLFDAQGNEVQAAGKFAGKTIIKEGQFFNNLRENPVVVNSVIAQYLSANKDRIQPR